MYASSIKTFKNELEKDFDVFFVLCSGKASCKNKVMVIPKKQVQSFRRHNAWEKNTWKFFHGKKYVGSFAFTLTV